MKLAIVITTYKRDDNKTIDYLTNTLLSIKNQTYQNYKIFLIGDKYEDNAEFELLATSIIDLDKIKFINLPVAFERDKYMTDSNTNLMKSNSKLWCCGGVNARNIGIEMALSDGFEYICIMDHDDTWIDNHLELINEQCDTNKYVIIATRAYINNLILPRRQEAGEFYPMQANIVHSSTCIKFSEIKLRYRDVFEETLKSFPADADLWIRLSEYMKENNLKGYLIDNITCTHK